MVVYLRGTVLYSDSGRWQADTFEPSISDGVMRGITNGSSGNAVLRKQ